MRLSFSQFGVLMSRLNCEKDSLIPQTNPSCSKSVKHFWPVWFFLDTLQACQQESLHCTGQYRMPPNFQGRSNTLFVINNCLSSANTFPVRAQTNNICRWSEGTKVTVSSRHKSVGVELASWRCGNNTNKSVEIKGTTDKVNKKSRMAYFEKIVLLFGL